MSRRRSRKVKNKTKVKPKHIKEEKEVKKVTKKPKLKYIVPLVLIALFFLVLFFNSYFNYTSGMAHNPEGTTLGTRFYLSGPDPYYNMRTCQVTLETGEYAYLSPTDGDPLLNYPVGYNGGARPPLFNMIAVGSTKLLENFMPTMDALGWSMLFLPAIYGALLVFPVYSIGKELFNRKVGLIAAFFIPIIPAHISGGHGSALALFDHDSFVLLLFTITFFFIIKLLKESNFKKKILYGVFAGISIGAVQLTWVAGHTILFMILGYIIVQLFFDILKSKYQIKNYISLTIAFCICAIISMPYFIIKQQIFNFPLIIFGVSIGILILVMIFNKIKAPAILILPISGIIGGLGLGFLYFIHIGYIKGISVLTKLTEIIFGSGIYGNKVAYTIAEAHTYGISQTVMNIGPALYWLGLVGFVLFMYKTYKTKLPPENLFLIITVIIQMWLLTTAGRFLNDLIPAMSIFSAFIIYLSLKKLDYKGMIVSIKRIGGLRGIYKSVTPLRIIAVVLIGVFVIGSNTFIALDGAVPPQMDKEVFGEDFQGYFGNSVSEQVHWSTACYWLSQQDTEIEDESERPAIISWWDYGFYIASMSEHPTVADNYQDGIFPASNFHTAQSEKEANAVLIVRLVEGTKEGTTKSNAVQKISNPKVKEVFKNYLGNESETLINILEDPVTYAPSYGTFVAKEWNSTMFTVRQHNAMYHDACDILVNLSDDELTELYIDMIEATGYSIRYYGIESRDIHSIFGVFPFLADKSSHNYDIYEDDWYRSYWYDNKGQDYSYEEIKEMTSEEQKELNLRPATEKKDTFYNSMIYRTFYGSSQENRLPTLLLKHWKIEYVEPYILISKYYAGAKINGTVSLGDIKYDGSMVYVIDEYRVQHDYSLVENGKFDVIVPGGNITLAVGIRGNIIQEINLGNITEEEAMREIPCNKTISFNVNYSEPSFNITGLNQTVNMSISSSSYESINFTTEVFNGNYSFDNIIPDEYIITLEKGNITYYQETKFLKPNKNIYNIKLSE